MNIALRLHSYIPRLVVHYKGVANKGNDYKTLHVNRIHYTAVKNMLNGMTICIDRIALLYTCSVIVLLCIQPSIICIYVPAYIS